MLKKFCQCIGLASVILVMNYGDLLAGGADVRMHVPFALGGIVLAQLADILLLGLALFLLLASVERTRFRTWARLLLAILVPPYVIARTETLYPFVIRNGLVPLFAGLWVALVLLLLLRSPRRYRQLLRIGDAVGIVFAVFALSSIAQLLWITLWKPGPQQHLAAWSNSPQPPRQHPLLVWVIFDELSFRQVFEHRAHDLDLPHFDALRRQSTLFTDVQPAGYKTVYIIPSLLSGQTVDDFRYKFDNRFLVHDTGTPGWHRLTGRQTVFQDARNHGWRTAAVGWYNPYCAIYGDAIDHCYWMNMDRIDGLMSQRDNLWHNTLSPFRQMVREIATPARAGRDACVYDVRQRFQTHVDLEQHALSLLHTDQADFVLLHMPIPHSPNIWSRLADGYTGTCDNSYLDNLALADRVLGHVLETLKASPRWNDTTLIVEGDHGWRTDLWDWLPAWTDEDDAAAPAEYDPRPALLVHQAGQTEGETDAAPWPLIRIHDVVEQVLGGQRVHF